MNVALETDVDPSSLRVVREDGSPIPFTLEGKSLHFFSGAPGMARVILGDRESVYSLSLPDIGDTRWQAPEGAATGLPRLGERLRSSHDLWQILALLGGLGLAVEWLLFGRFNRCLATPATFFTCLPYGEKHHDFCSILGFCLLRYCRWHGRLGSGVPRHGISPLA